jgi:hypothetical protein
MTESNQLTGTIPTELIQLTSLTDLELGKNGKYCFVVALILAVFGWLM